MSKETDFLPPPSHFIAMNDPIYDMIAGEQYTTSLLIPTLLYIKDSKHVRDCASQIRPALLGMERRLSDVPGHKIIPCAVLEWGSSLKNPTNSITLGYDYLAQRLLLRMGRESYHSLANAYLSRNIRMEKNPHWKENVLRIVFDNFYKSVSDRKR